MTAAEFAVLARQVADEARSSSGPVLVFRAPPAAGLDRSVRVRPDGAVVVAVRYRDRDEEDVLADLRAGVEAASGMIGAHRCKAVTRSANTGV